MIIVMRPGADENTLQHVCDVLDEAGFAQHVSRGQERTIVGVIGDERELDQERIAAIDGVERVIAVLAPYRLAASAPGRGRQLVQVGDSIFGGDDIPVIAGPCSVESRDQIMRAAEQLAEQGVRILRGGAFKPRTSPYSFQGMGEEGLQILAAAREEYGLSIVTEVMTSEEVELVASYADMLQIGTRNMANYRLLEKVGAQSKPVLLKRGMSATLEEWLLAAEYVMSGGNHQVVLCERGIKSFEPQLRGACDVGSLALARELSCLPVILDPSHATGKASLVAPAAWAGIAAGADGLIIEVHEDPERAFSDGAQSLRPQDFNELMKTGRAVAAARGRKLS